MNGKDDFLKSAMQDPIIRDEVHLENCHLILSCAMENGLRLFTCVVDAAEGVRQQVCMSLRA